MRRVRRFEHILRLKLLIHLINALNIEQSINNPVFFTDQRYSVAHGKPGSHFILDRQRNRDTPYRAVSETHAFDNGVVVFFIQKAGKRRKRTYPDQIQIR
ncbi:hypothetical protein D3C75_1171190 [compost metagenome]